MCLIVCKPRGSKLPKGKKLRYWFNNYPHGFGLAFPHEGKVRILKGALDHEEMFTLLDRMRDYLEDTQPKDIDIIFQFRAAVTGSVCPRFCHPFPVTKNQEDLDSLDVLTDCALTHNGVIYEYAVHSMYKPLEDINDAQEFIKDHLVDMGDSIYNPEVQKLIETDTMSKYALLSKRGIDYIGEFIKDNGYWFSNGGYKPNKQANVHYKHKGFEEWQAEHEFSETTSCEPTKRGCQCEFCLEYHPVVYHLPSEDYIVCWDCFVQLIGKTPSPIHIAY